jgi:hypothetical protein
MPQQGLLQGQAPQQAQPQGVVQPQTQPVQASAPQQSMTQQPAQQQQPMQQGAKQGAPGKRNYETDPPNEKDQEQMNRFEVNVIKLIHSEGMTDKIIAQIKNPKVDKHPIDKISDVAFLMMKRLDEQAKKDGDPLDDLVKIQGGSVLVAELLAVLEAKEAIPETNEDEKALVLAHATQKYSDSLIQSGQATREELRYYSNQGMSAANQTGDIDMDKVRGKRDMSQDAEDMKSAGVIPEPVVRPQPNTPTMTERLANGSAGQPQGGLING